MPVGDGSDVLLWAPAGASHVRELRRGREYSTVATAGGRVAWIGGDGLREGTRVTVIDARFAPHRLPRAAEQRRCALSSFDGRAVAFATASCALAGPARGAPPRGARSRGRLPALDAAVDPTPTIRGDRYRVQVACINAPGRAAACSRG